MPLVHCQRKARRPANCFEARPTWSKDMLDEVARAWAEALGWKTGNAFMLLRIGVTGRKASPPLFETMEALGKEITRRRLRRVADVIASGGKRKQ